MTGYYIAAGVIIIILGLILTLYFVIRKGIRSLTKEAEKDSFWPGLIINIGKAIEDKRIADAAPKPQSLIEIKKNAICKTGLKTFYYLDKDEIELLFPQISNGIRLSSVTTTKKEGKTTELGASASNSIKLGIGRNNQNESTQQYNVSNNISAQYNEIESYFIEQGSLTFGIEEFDFDEQAFANFKRDCGFMETIYGYAIKEHEQEEHWIKIKKEAAKEYLKIIISASGYIAIQSEIHVKKIENDTYFLNFKHPINNFIELDQKISIEIACNKNYFTPFGQRTLVEGKSLQITQIGKVIRWDDSTRTLEINPIAIY